MDCLSGPLSSLSSIHPTLGLHTQLNNSINEFVDINISDSSLNEFVDINISDSSIN